MGRLVAEARAAGSPAAVGPLLAERLRACHARAALARRLTEGAVVRIVGRPNAGKSTLFNALLGERRALTSPIAGTTRDVVRARLALNGVPVLLEDWAGGASTDADVDLTVHLLTEKSEKAWPGTNVLPILGQADRRTHRGPSAVSGVTGEGLAALADRVADLLDLSGGPADDALAPVDPDQRRLVADLVAALDRA